MTGGTVSDNATANPAATRAGSLPVAFEGAAGNRLVGTLAGRDGEAGELDTRRCGKVALLLHGGGQTRHAWSRTTARLAASGWTGIAVDQRGHGDSDWPADGAYAFHDFAADAAKLGRDIAAQCGSRPVAVGASLGGIAALLALGGSSGSSHPEGAPFAGLVLVDIVPRMEARGVAHIQDFMRANAADGFASIQEAADSVARYLPHRPRPPSLSGLRKNLRRDAGGRWRWHWDPRFLDGPRPVNGDAQRMQGELDEAARTLRVPTLLVRGGSSELVSPAAAAAFLALAPQAEFADIAQARHMVAGDRNDAFTDAIVGFLGRRFG